MKKTKIKVFHGSDHERAVRHHLCKEVLADMFVHEDEDGFALLSDRCELPEEFLSLLAEAVEWTGKLAGSKARREYISADLADDVDIADGLLWLTSECEKRNFAPYHSWSKWREGDDIHNPE